MLTVHTLEFHIGPSLYFDMLVKRLFWLSHLLKIAIDRSDVEKKKLVFPIPLEQLSNKSPVQIRIQLHRAPTVL